MTKFRVLAVLLFAAVSFTGFAVDVDSLVYPELNPVRIPELREEVLDNGLRLYLLEDKSLPIIQASVRIHGGSYLDPTDKFGRAYLTGTLLRTGGTQKWTSDELDELLEGIGASVETNIDIVAGSLSLFMLSSYTDLAIEVMAEVLRRPRFDENRFKQAMIGYRSSIARRNDSPTSIGSREFDKIIYGPASVYARHTEYKTLDAISIGDLKEFHGMVFNPENIQVSIWGDIDADRIVELIKKHFADWPKGKKPLAAFPGVDYEFVSSVAYVNQPEASQSNVYIGHLGGRYSDPDNPHRIVMNNILGSGFSSRLFKEIRSKAGLAYSVWGHYGANMSYPGIFYNYVATKSDTTAKVIRMVIDEVRKLQNEPPTAGELKLAKDLYINTFVFNFDCMSKILSRIVFYDFFGLPRDHLNKEREMVEATTAEDVVAVAKKYLKPDAMRILVVGNIKGLDEPLDKLGFGDPVEIDITIPEP